MPHGGGTNKCEASWWLSPWQKQQSARVPGLCYGCFVFTDILIGG